MNKKADLFIIDAVIALLILTAGFFLISSTYESRPVVVTSRHVAQDLLNILASTKVKNLCSCPCNANFPNLHQSYCLDHDITLADNSMLEAIAEVKRSGGDPENIIQEIIEAHNLIPEGYSVGFYIDDIEIFTSSGAMDPAKARLLTSSKKVILGMYRDASGELQLLPNYIMEIRVWRE